MQRPCFLAYLGCTEGSLARLRCTWQPRIIMCQALTRLCWLARMPARWKMYVHAGRGGRVAIGVHVAVCTRVRLCGCGCGGVGGGVTLAIAPQRGRTPLDLAVLKNGSKLAAVRTALAAVRLCILCHLV